MRSPPILLVADFLHPMDGRAVERFLDGDVAQGRGRRGAMPMLLAGRDPDHIAGANVLDRLPLTLNPAATSRDNQGLAERMRVPRRTRAGLEGDEVHADTGRF